ncbi:Cupin domain protein [Rubripirellula tenax]|uniref:Cupin domain protein n=1 Tax=Rubripirellula tenax TaxID=2528015 RepID=A0A5C6EJP2_9BACT|nr:cupin domain-containing protein [Rubripirellula tenax]TWU48635.1 Cupin domain protein [Rubripirellula tenax]
MAGNLFSDLPTHLLSEQTDALVSSEHVRVERILSMAHQSPDGFWYDQIDDEWVAVLSGGEVIEFDDGGDVSRLGPGDWINIPAHRRHRVAWTTPEEPTVWLAVFSKPNPTSS